MDEPSALSDRVRLLQPDVGQWLAFGVLTVRDARVIHLELERQLGDDETVAQFASALSNPPSAPQR